MPDLGGKGGRVRTVAIPVWVKRGINAWMIGGEDYEDDPAAAALEEREVDRRGAGLTGSIWRVVENFAKETENEHFERP